MFVKTLKSTHFFTDCIEEKKKIVLSFWPDLAFHSDEEDLEDEDDFNSEASVVSTEIVENNNAKVRQVLDEFRSANASMAAEAAKKYPLLKPLTR